MALSGAQVAYPGFAAGPYATAYLGNAYAPTFGYSAAALDASATSAATLGAAAPARTALDVFNPYPAAYNFHPYANLYASSYFPYANYFPAAFAAAAPVAVAPAAAAPAAVAAEPVVAPTVKVSLERWSCNIFT